MTEVFCGIDWAEGHHDIALVDQQGQLLVSRRIEDTAAGLVELPEMLSTAGDHAEDRIPAAIETTRGLLVAALRSSGRDVYAINLMAVSRYRDRHTVSRKKSDAQDAAALANILSTDRHAHRPCLRIPNSFRPSRCWRVRSRTQSGNGSSNPTGSGSCCGSTTPLRGPSTPAPTSHPLAPGSSLTSLQPCQSCQAKPDPAQSCPAQSRADTQPGNHHRQAPPDPPRHRSPPATRGRSGLRHPALGHAWAARCRLPRP